MISNINLYNPKVTPHNPQRLLDGVLINGNGVVRNAMAAEQAFHSASPAIQTAISSLAYITGGSAIVLGGLTLKGAYGQYRQASKINDGEGKRESLINGAAGTSMVAFGTGLIGTTAAPALAAFGLLTPISGLALFGSFGINAAIKINSIHHFRKELKQTVDPLTFLLEQTTLTEDDLHAGDLEKKAQEKWDKFVRRVGPAAANEVKQKLPGLIVQNDPEKAKALVELVDKNSRKELIKNILILVLAIVGIAGLIASLLAIPGAGPILFIFASALILPIVFQVGLKT